MTSTMNLSKSKNRIPWQLKIASKIILSKLPISFELWRKFKLFQHGDMNTGDYALGVFHRHCGSLIETDEIKGSALLELGPGDGISSGLLAFAHGAAHTYLVDAGDFAERDMQVYQNILSHWKSEGIATERLKGCSNFDELCTQASISYLTDGLSSLKKIPTDSVDFIYSHAVLEHIRYSEFIETMTELKRVLKPNGQCSHKVDLKDHLGGSLNNLRFSDKVWEGKLFASSGFYTNRIRFSEMIQLCEKAGFLSKIKDLQKWDMLPTPKNEMWSKFQQMPDDDLLVSGFEVILIPS